jgi:hypothetical protein
VKLRTLCRRRCRLINGECSGSCQISDVLFGFSVMRRSL